ncbi:hypothetical protein HY386_01895 [Candidatus Daviesbacteria bacterium]|nr:hypothetical protein [Candidatus Daviesbacteria bacterium]
MVSEEDSQTIEIKERSRRQDAAGAAFRGCMDQISTTERFTPEEARRLGGLFLARLLEFELFVQDVIQFENTIGGLPRWHNPHERGKLEKALFDAQKGDYRKFREALSLSSQGAWVQKGLREKLSEIARLIPDQGEPFRPPPPAWQDPEFTQL